MGRPIADRSSWRTAAALALCAPALRDAEKLVGQPVPQLPDELYLEFSRNGNRSHYETRAFQRRAQFSVLVLAECAEDRGRFLPQIAAYADAFCAERTWVWPAHDKGSVNFDGKAVEIDLGAAELGWQLATARWLLGERLPAATRERIAQNIIRRVVEPYLAAATGKAKPFAWMSRTNNWNAVCHAGVVGAALATVPDRTTRAVFIVSAERNLQRFLDGFGADGYCSEGLAYWNYGFGHYVLLAETVRQATSGQVDLMTRAGVRDIATFGSDIGIMNGVVPAFADCPINAAPAPQITRYVNARFGFGQGGDKPFGVQAGRSLLYDQVLYAFLDPSKLPTLKGDERTPRSALRKWFPSAGVLVARPAAGTMCRIGIALKGGNNAENHNHNDLGSYVVVLNNEPVLLDPGAEHYTARTFGPRRYDSKLLNSFGHPVPMVAGQLQRTGAAAQARIVRTDFTDETDTVTMDLTSAYAVPNLKRMERTFVYDRRDAGSLTVTDHVEFASPQSFGTALITAGTLINRTGDVYSVGSDARNVQVRVDTGGAAYIVESETIREDAPVTPTRIGVNLTEKVVTATITVRITPP
jgi:hypothetical protein